MGKLQKRFSLLAAAKERDFEEEVLEVPTTVPDDVKEGHCHSARGQGFGEKRFVVKLKYLNRPAFLRLLEQAEEEYGFEQTGALVVFCGPEELQKILGRHTGDKSQILKSRPHNFM